MMKKKSILMLIAAGAVLCAVICAAGCVSSDEDDDAALIGTWYHEGNGHEAVLTLSEDYTGILCTIRDDDGLLTKLPGFFPYITLFAWDLDGNKLTFVLEDGRMITAAVDEKTGVLTTDKLGFKFEPVDLASEDADVEYVWYYEDDTYSEISIDLEDNTGLYYALEFKADKNVNAMNQFTGSTDIYAWVPDGEGHEITTCSDGSVSHNTYDKDHTTLTSDRRGGMVYVGMPDTFTAFLSMLAWAEEHVTDSKTV